MPWDDGLSDEQRGIVQDPARLKIVRAGPGTGKTRLFVGALQKQLSGWTHTKSGIAALSYTNVAQQEIESRTGHFGYPHITTTIDSFILRYVVRPFAHIVTKNPNGVRLLPEPVAERYTDDVQVGVNNAQRSKLTDIAFIGYDDKGCLIMSGYTNHRREFVHESRRNSVLRAKQQLWRNQGLLTHNDCHFVAHSILDHQTHGDQISQMISRRFPAVLVDEYQDTNYFLGLTLKKLFSQPNVNGLVVGDTDQAIYEFGGARPSLMEELEEIEGAKCFSLRKTYRCSTSVAAVAEHLSQNHAKVVPTDLAGETIICAHNGIAEHVAQLIDAMRQPTDQVAVLARRTSTIEELRGRSRRQFPGSSKIAKGLHEAASLLHTDPRKSSQVAGAILAKLTLDDAFPTKIKLEELGITTRAWRQAVWQLLVAAAASVEGESWGDWVTRLRPALTEAASTLGITIRQSINQALPLRGDLSAIRNPPATAATPAWLNESIVSTIHGVKGREFDVVILHYPEPSAGGVSRCISNQWWDDQSAEERRVAFVAVTRAKRAFILSVHKKTYDALKKQRPSFIRTFSRRLER